MTTPTTPAADASRETIIEALDQYTRGDEHQRAIEAAIDALKTATARESALVAERDALRLVASDLLEACKVAFDQTCSVGRAKDWKQLLAAIDQAEACRALAAPAVEG